jgi:putative transcriptional regulator
MDQTWQSLKGQFLMAMPGLADPNFYQSVTCLSEHNPKGAMGIVITRVHPEINGKMIFDELQISTAAGAKYSDPHRWPVHMNEIFVLHGAPFTWSGSMMITGELALSNSRDILEAIAGGNGPQAYIIAWDVPVGGPASWKVKSAATFGLTGPIRKPSLFEWRWKDAGKRPCKVLALTRHRYPIPRPCLTASDKANTGVVRHASSLWPTTTRTSTPRNWPSVMWRFCRFASDALAKRDRRYFWGGRYDRLDGGEGALIGPFFHSALFFLGFCLGFFFFRQSLSFLTNAQSFGL